MKYFFLLLFGLLFFFFLFLYQSNKLQPLKENPLVKSPNTKEILKPFSSIDLKNNSISSESFLLKKTFFVHLWGTWCGPCLKEFPVLIHYAKYLESQNINFYLIAMNDDLKSVKKFINSFNPLPTNIMILIDNQGKISNILHSNQVPETYLYSSKGELINKFVGPQDWNSIYFQQLDLQ